MSLPIGQALLGTHFLGVIPWRQHLLRFLITCPVRSSINQFLIHERTFRRNSLNKALACRHASGQNSTLQISPQTLFLLETCPETHNLQSRHPKHPSAAGVNMSCSGVNMSCSRGKCAYLEPQLFFAPYVTFFSQPATPISLKIFTLLISVFF